MADRKVKQWITVNGVHVPIFEGESKADGVKRAIEKAKSNAKSNEDQKAKDIAKNEKQKDELNGKKENNNNDIASKKYADIKKDLDNMKTGDIVEYTFKDEDGETGKEIYVKQKDGSYKLKNGYGEHDDSEYLADYMKENNKGSYKVRDLAKEDSDRLAKTNKQISDYNKQKEEAAKKSNAISEDKLNDAIKYYKENSFGYGSIEDYVRTDFPFASKEKQDAIIKAMTNKISGGSLSDASSGKAVDEVRGKKEPDWVRPDPSSEEVNAKFEKQEIARKQRYIRQAEKTHGKKWVLERHRVPESFAANYPNLSSTQIIKKYEEYLKKNRKK